MKNQDNKVSPPKTRINKIMLGSLERPALHWMAKHLPSWVLPDHLSLVAIIAAVVIFISYWLTRFSLDWLWLVNFGLIVHWAGDSLDGTLARVRHIERERYGLFVDHNCDTIAMFLICVGMGVSPLMDLRISLLVLIAYYSMSILVYLVSMASGVFKISFGGLGPTEVRLAIIIANIIIWCLKNPVVGIGKINLTIFSWIGLIAAIILLVTYLIYFEIERRKLARLDPMPKRK